MKRISVSRVVGIFIPLLLSGCVQSHRYPQAVAVPPARVVVPEPTSVSPAVRVYPDVPGRTVPAAVATGDLRVAESVRQVLKATPALESLTQNVEATVDNGVVTLRGTVPTQADRQLLTDRLARLPDVARVNNQLTVDLN